MTGRFKQALLEKGDMSGLTQKGGHKRSTKSGAGLTQKGVDAVNRKTGGNLKTAVTTPPSKLKPDSKPAKRRKSFCARSSGWTGERGKAARSRWNCSTDINTKGDPAMNERNKQNRDAVRQMTSGQTPAEAKAQRSLKTANPDWITPEDKKSPRQQAHDSRRGVRQAREALSNAAIDKMKKEMSNNLNANLEDAKKHKATSGMRLPKPKAKDNQRSDTEDGRSFKTGVRQAREALAEACWKGYKAKGMKKKGSKRVPNCVKEAVLGEAVKRRSQTAVNELPPKDLGKLEKGLEKAKPGRVARATGKPAPVEEKPEKKPRVRREVLNKSGGKHTPDGMPVQTSSDHTDYVRKKHYQNNQTRGKGYAKSGTATKPESIEKINRRGLTNKSPAKQERARKKFAKLDNAPSPTQSGKDYAKGEYDPSMSKDTTWGDDEG